MNNNEPKWGKLTNVSEIQQQSGYAKAAINPQALNGAVPVIDLNKKGDLQKLFSSKTPNPFVEGLAAKMPRPADTIARNISPQPPEQEQTKATEQVTKQQEFSPEQVRGQPPADNNQQSILPDDQNTAKEPATAYIALVPPQFLPVLAAGILSAQYVKAAENPDGYVQGDEFKFGSAAGRHQRRVLERIEDNMEEGREDGRANKRDLALQYAADQQRQQFMRSTEYAVAMYTVDQHIHQQEQRMELLHSDIQELSEQMGYLDQRIETTELEIESTAERGEQIETALKDRETHAQNAAEATNANTVQEELEARVNDLPTIAMAKGDNGTYFLTKENGKEVTYLATPNGDVKQITYDDYLKDGGCNRPKSVYLESLPGGGVEFKSDRGGTLTQEERDQLNSFMAATEKTGNDLGDKKEFDTRKAAATQHADNVLIPALDRAASSEGKLAASMQKLGLPMDQAVNLEKHLEENQKKLGDLRDALAKDLNDKKMTAEAMAAKRGELAEAERSYNESKAFKERLEKGDFRDKEEMLKAMPADLKTQYEYNKEEALAAKAKTAPPTQENTSRTNGSAAASYEGTSNSGALSGEFQNAATNTTPEATPEAPAPAPSNDMEYNAARQQPKSQAGGMVL